MSLRWSQSKLIKVHFTFPFNSIDLKPNLPPRPQLLGVNQFLELLKYDYKNLALRNDVLAVKA